MLIVRTATTRDIVEVAPLFLDLLMYLRSNGNGNYLFCDDDQLCVGGVLEFLSARINLQGSGCCFLVGEDRGKIVSFVIGTVLHFPKFLRHQILGDVEYAYPISFKLTPLMREFDEWAKRNGATGRSCRCDVENKRSNEVFRRHQKAHHLQNVYIKTYT